MKATLVFQRTEHDNVGVTWTETRLIEVTLPEDIRMVPAYAMGEFQLTGMTYRPIERKEDD